MSTMPFSVAKIDGTHHHFSNLANAIEFAGKQARVSWNNEKWTVKIKRSLSGRIVVDRSNRFEVLFDGQVRAQGNLSHHKGTPPLFTGTNTLAAHERNALGYR